MDILLIAVVAAGVSSFVTGFTVVAQGEPAWWRGLLLIAIALLLLAAILFVPALRQAI